MATSTAPIGQSLFDFLDGKTGLEQLEALQSGALGREINRYVQTQLEQFNIGSIQDSIQNSIWGNGSWNSTNELRANQDQSHSIATPLVDAQLTWLAITAPDHQHRRPGT